jgi:hypothetical protein
VTRWKTRSLALLRGEIRNADQWGIPLWGGRTTLVATVIAIAVGALFAVRTLRAQSNRAAQSSTAPTLTPQQRIQRSEFFAIKLGLQFGVPSHARANAIAKAATLSSAAIAASSLPLIASPTWSNIGPLPMTEPRTSAA